MNCPFCGEIMAEGTFHDRGDSYFLPAGETPPKLWTRGVLEKKRAVILPPESFGAPFAPRPAAFWCGKCRKLLVDYGELLPPTGRWGHRPLRTGTDRLRGARRLGAPPPCGVIP